MSVTDYHRLETTQVIIFTVLLIISLMWVLLAKIRIVAGLCFLLEVPDAIPALGHRCLWEAIVQPTVS